MTSSLPCFGHAPPLAHQATPTGTIGEVIRQQLSMTIYCEHRGCGHHAAVDLEGIQAEYGDNFPVSGFVARSKCSRCGVRRLGPGIGDTTSPLPPAAL